MNTLAYEHPLQPVIDFITTEFEVPEYEYIYGTNRIRTMLPIGAYDCTRVCHIDHDDTALQFIMVIADISDEPQERQRCIFTQLEKLQGYSFTLQEGVLYWGAAYPPDMLESDDGLRFIFMQLDLCLFTVDAYLGQILQGAPDPDAYLFARFAEGGWAYA